MTKGTLDKKIAGLIEQEEQLKVMFQKIQGAKEALTALKEELVDTIDTDDTNTNGTTKRKTVKSK